MKNIFSSSKRNFILLVLFSFGLGAFFSFKIAKSTFSDETIQSAAAIAGLEFDKKEIELMREDLKSQVESYQKIIHYRKDLNGKKRNAKLTSVTIAKPNYQRTSTNCLFIR